MVQGGRVARHALEPAVRQGRELLSGNEIESKLADALERLSQALEALLREEAGRRGLSPIQARFLVYLLHRPVELRRVGELAREFGLTPATASGAVDALQRKGLLVREEWPEDRRYVTLRLTGAGRSIAGELSGWSGAVREPLGELGGEEKEVLLGALLRLVASLQREGLVRVRMCLSCRFFRPDVHPGRERPHHCALLDAPLAVRELRVDCPEHELHVQQGGD
ncbi:MAG: MarR family winged helix-turn-helix transcriptional regulator [Rubrobacteraceae bacterium]|nr:MarR family winged helix-turn-helix transcriptional regulator [Rubrobacteraceae bacterium]